MEGIHAKRGGKFKPRFKPGHVPTWFPLEMKGLLPSPASDGRIPAACFIISPRLRGRVPIRIGTSGWSYPDWVGPFYPKGTEAGAMLPHYATRFPTVEINSTFYATPPLATIRGWVQRAAKWPGFEYSVKAPRSLTQEALARGTRDTAQGEAMAFRQNVLDPIGDKLGAVLLQFAPSVRRDDAALKRVDAALGALYGLDIAVELRDPSWLQDDGRPHDDIMTVLDAYGAALVLFDGPHMPVTEAGKADHAYVRFHGRNADVWDEHGKVEGDPDDPRMNRYDYEYARDELVPWAERLAALEKRKNVVRVYFNNHPGAHAATDAEALGALLARDGVSVAQPEARQQRLSLE